MGLATIRHDKLLTAAERGLLADHVYFRPGETPPLGWEILCTSDSFFPAAHDFFGALYRRRNAPPRNDDVVFAFRGTNNARDLGADLSIFLGHMPRQCAIAADFVKQACAAQGVDPRKVEIAGHSMGGYLAYVAGWEVKAKYVWTFNSPVPSPAVRDMLAAQSAVPSQKRVYNKVLHVRSRYDVVSLWGNEAKNVFEVDTEDQHHQMKSLYRALMRAAGAAPVTTLAPAKPPSALVAAFNRVAKRVTQIPEVDAQARRVFSHPLRINIPFFNNKKGPE
jgi:hypothetical protein